jgi:hypothetical protein
LTFELKVFGQDWYADSHTGELVVLVDDRRLVIPKGRWLAIGTIRPDRRKVRKPDEMTQWKEAP